MNIIYVNWACFGAEDAVEALHKLGHNVYVTQLTEQAHVKLDEMFMENLSSLINEQKANLVFTFNYFPSVSEVCQQKGCRYLAWMYDNPYTKVYDKSIANECNYIASFDSWLVNDMKTKGVDTVHYAPLAVNMRRLRSIPITENDRERFTSDISFMGSLYNEAHNFYDRLIEKSKDAELQGYLDAIMLAQRKMWGCNILPDCLSKEIVDKIDRYLPYQVAEGSYISKKEVYADYYLARRLAYIERVELLEYLGRYFKVVHYTHNKDVKIGNVENRGSLHYFEEMPKAFQLSKVNINTTLRSIRNGIPLRAMDILGAGGFLMSNYQSDLLKHFEPEKHFTCYSSVEEAVDKADYYLRHEKERKKIVENASHIVEQEHTYEIRFENLLKEIFS